MKADGTEPSPNVAASSRHPFDVGLQPIYKKRLKFLKLLLRVREAYQAKSPARVPGQPKPLVQAKPSAPPVHLPLPAAVRPVVTS
jgi:hypothetical protein